MAKIPEFGVKSNSNNFEIYERFKADAEKIGIKYQSEFTEFKQNNQRYWSCLWFGKGFEGCKWRGLGMSLSNPENIASKLFDLDTRYDEALAYLREWFELYKPKKRTTNE